MTRKVNLLLTLLLMVSLALVACGGGDDQPADTKSPAAKATEPPAAAGDAGKGKDLYSKSCSACHGPNGEGVTGLGKPFMTSEFVKDSSDDDLLAFVKRGRPVGDSANTTGVDMPPKGGNPALTDGDLRDILAFIRTMQ
jgi:disulfide bond formation protein DsbB